MAVSIDRQAWMEDDYWQEMKRFLEYYFGPAAKDRYGSALPNYRNITLTALDALKELLDNPPDAEATHIRVVIYPKTLVVMDNGHGMVPFFTKEGLCLANERIEAIGRNSLGANDDLRGIVTDVSQRSLLWAATLAGMSAKAGRVHSTGYRGVGIQAASQIGEPIEFICRPRADLAEEFYSDPKLAENPPIFKWTMPTLDQIIKRQVDPNIQLMDGGFVDHNGNPISHGTIVRINNIRPEALNVFKTDTFIRVLQSRYGARIRSGLVIEIVDRFSPEGLKTPGGKITQVPRSEYKGHLILDRSGEDDQSRHLVLKTRGQTLVVRAQLHWNPDLRDRETVMLRREGLDLVPITSVEGLNRHPWDIEGLSGYVEFPEEPVDTKGLSPQAVIAERTKIRYLQGSTDKKSVAEGPHLNAWIRLLKERLEDEIQPAVDKLKSEVRKREVDEISKEMETHIRDVLSEDSEISQLMRLPQVKSPKGNVSKASGGNPRGPKTDVPAGELHISVQNEHRMGISGVNLVVTRSGQRIAAVASLGAKPVVLKVPSGTYQVEVKLQPGWELEEAYNPFPVSLTKHVGKRMIFHVITKSPAPPKTPRLSGIHIWGNSFGTDRIGDIFDDEHFKASGTIRYNTDHPTVEESHQAGHEVQWRAVLAHIASEAISRNFLEESFGPSIAIQKKVELFSHFMRATQPKTKRRK